jgi:cytochrome c biogenesis protein CcdA
MEVSIELCNNLCLLPIILLSLFDIIYSSFHCQKPLAQLSSSKWAMFFYIYALIKGISIILLLLGFHIQFCRQTISLSQFLILDIPLKIAESSAPAIIISFRICIEAGDDHSHYLYSNHSFTQNSVVICFVTNVTIITACSSM